MKIFNLLVSVSLRDRILSRLFTRVLIAFYLKHVLLWRCSSSRVSTGTCKDLFSLKTALVSDARSKEMLSRALNERISMTDRCAA